MVQAPLRVVPTSELAGEALRGSGSGRLFRECTPLSIPCSSFVGDPPPDIPARRCDPTGTRMLF